jgi:chemotaxis receptor (MCP) glutamine deamidase CheD
MAHILLPCARGTHPGSSVYQYADTALPALLESLHDTGA